MAEAIAALSIAANVIQFVDFGAKTVSTFWQFARSAEDAKGGIPDVLLTTSSLQELLISLQSSTTGCNDIPEEERSLYQLVEGCQNVARELLELLSKIKVPAKGRKRDALKAACRMALKEEDIKSLQARLDNFRGQLTVNLLASLRVQVQKSIDQQEKVLHELQNISAGTENTKGKNVQAGIKTDNLGIFFLDVLFSKAGASNHSSDRERWQKDLIAAIYQDGLNGSHRISAPSLTNERQQALQSAMLERLRYPGMADRGERIAVAFEKTFQWIFEDQSPQGKPWSNFKEWLKSDAELYWITGKAGSGKSTLMKFICDHEASDTTSASSAAEQQRRCEKHLKKWAAGSKLIIVTFFFWGSGIGLQKTQRGLLLSVMFQILQQCPELWPTVSPSRWEALCLLNEDPHEWTEQELRHMLWVATQHLTKDSKVCLFVDGLDEFEGDLNDLIWLFKSLIANSNLKVCVSSRPWVEFEDAFQHKPSLMLQDLTYTDIEHYVSASFQADSGFGQLCKREPQYASQLVKDIVDKASGVFLWVHLVVASLIAGMCYGDRVSDLRRRIDQLPGDLENLYQRIVMSLDPFYLEHAAQLFKLVQESTEPPSLLLLSFTDEENPGFALNRSVEPISQEEKSLRADTMRRRLNSRCKGLLEAGQELSVPGDHSEDTVQYLHRSVKDYIESPGVQKRFVSVISESFDPHLMLCSGSLAHLKAMDADILGPERNEIWTRVLKCVYNASRIHNDHRAYVIPLLEDIDKTGVILAKWTFEKIMDEGNNLGARLQLGSGQWVSTYSPKTIFPLRSKNILNWQKRAFVYTFESLVTRYGIVEYLEEKANSGCLCSSQSGDFEPIKWPLLLDAVEIVSRSSQTRFPDVVPNLDTIRCLLRKGADPNYRIPGFDPNYGDLGSTIWLMAIYSILENFNGNKIMSPWDEVAALMIKHGAKVDKKLRVWIKFYNDLPGMRPHTDAQREVFYQQLLKIQRDTRPDEPFHLSSTNSRKSLLPWHRKRRET
ncbi:MAG: hypothetical protein Q9191_006642 [Dirinaria sp. TL-2023a]